MRVLIILNKSPAERYLVHLYNKTLIAEVRDLVNDKRYPKAITTALTKGIFERAIMRDELPGLEAGLILSEKSASWDLIHQ